MRTTVDLPPSVHARARALAEERQTSLSAIVAELTSRGLAQLDEPRRLRTDPVTGLPTIRTGRPVTSNEVADLLEDERPCACSTPTPSSPSRTNSTSTTRW